MNNIWYIHPYAGSPRYGMSFRPYYLAKYFNKMGYNPTIISGANHHLSKFPKQVEGLQEIEGENYFLVSNLPYKGNGLSRLINMLGFGLNLFSKKFKDFAKKNNPKVIIASTAHPFHIFAAKYYAKKYNAKLILEVRDIWPLSLQELVGISKKHPLSILINFFQKYAYRNCDHCVSLLENAENYFISQGLKANSFTCIPNGVDIAENSLTKIKPVDISTVILKMKKSLEKYDTIVGYTGAIGIPNNLEPFIRAAKLVRSHNIAFILVGDGIEKIRLKELCEKESIDNVIFFEPVAKAIIIDVISLCDAMFINAMPKDIYKFGISPNKIFDYMLCEKPIFNGINSPNNPMEKAGVEIKFESNSYKDLAEKIIHFHENKHSFKVNSLAFIKTHHSYEALAKEYKKLFTFN